MSTSPWFVRIAEPYAAWEETDGGGLDERAHSLASETTWSLFLAHDAAFERRVLAAFYGSRSGRGPLVKVAALRVSSAFISSLGTERLEHTPHNFTNGTHRGEPGWPSDVANAH